jgi:putative SOS response-associated peptidase YedK
MCGRYTYYSSSELLKRYELSESTKAQLELALDLPDNYNVSPGNTMPVIIRGGLEHHIEFMRWGLIPSWAKDEKIGYKLINAREETLLEKSTWKRLVKSKRCIIPARGFYEWKKLTDGSKQPYYITLKDSDVMSFAGLYDEWQDTNGVLIMSFTIITTKPNTEMLAVHDRMPVILDKQLMDLWLEPQDVSQSKLDDLLAPLPDGSLNIVRVSSEINNARNNTKKLIYPLE